MKALTIFSTPKPFTDAFIATIQRNALESWVRLGPEVEVVLIGDEEGVGAISTELGLKHVPQVERNEWGTPLVRSLFARAREASASPLLAIVNADILLMPDFAQAAKLVAEQRERFLIIGRRWGLDIDSPLDFSLGWEDRLRQRVRAEGELHPIFSIDYFVFPRTQYINMPDFVIGRPQWDNWMIYHAFQQGWTIVDVTPSVMAVHENHDYRHLPGGRPPHGLEEGKRNRRLAGGERARYLIIDAHRRLIDGELRRIPPSLERGLRWLERWLMRRRWRGLEWRAINAVRSWRRRAGEPIADTWVAGGLKKAVSAPDGEGA